MDLLRQMAANRAAMRLESEPLPKPSGTTKSERTAMYKPGTKAMRKHIIEEKPAKRHVMSHFEAIVEKEVEKTMEPSSSDEE